MDKILKIYVKHLFIVLLLICSIFKSYGQQEIQYTQYMYSMNLLNPAYAGSKDFMSLNFLSRVQWLGIDGGPQTITISLDTPLGKRIGLGGSVVYDQIGPRTENNFYGDISYTLKTSEEGRLAFGLKGGVSLYALKERKLLLPGDPLNFPEKGGVNLTGGAGLLYYFGDKFYLGMSITNLSTIVKEVTDFSFLGERKTHYFLTTGYVFEFEKFKFKPSTLVKAVAGVPISIDFSANFMFREKVEVGVSYRLRESYSITSNIYARKGLRIGYAFDMPISRFFNVLSPKIASHELFLLFDFDLKNRIKSPRFF